MAGSQSRIERELGAAVAAWDRGDGYCGGGGGGGRGVGGEGGGVIVAEVVEELVLVLCGFA